MGSIKERLEGAIPILGRMAAKRRRRRSEKEYDKWIENCCPIPPPHVVKQKVILEYAREYNCRVLVETGTYYGDMIEAMRDEFDQLISIELNREFYENACKRFAEFDHVKIVHGDSGQVMKTVVKKLEAKAIFWLDGHYSAGETAKGKKETPIFEELDAIFDCEGEHVILIDDAREFSGDNDYPTIAELNNYVLKCKPQAGVDVSDDVIRIVYSM